MRAGRGVPIKEAKRRAWGRTDIFEAPRIKRLDDIKRTRVRHNLFQE